MLKPLNIVVIGELNVGKTSILKQFLTKSFDGVSSTTVGLDFVTLVFQPKSA